MGNRRSIRIGFLVATLGAILGCQPTVQEGGVAGSGIEADCRAIAKRFGESVLSGDWAAAHAMTSPSFRARVSKEQMEAGYAELMAMIREDDPQFLPNAVDTDMGELPDDEADASHNYEILNPPPKETWRGWTFAEVGFKAPGEDTIERGIDALLLIVEEGNQFTIAWVDWEFMD